MVHVTSSPFYMYPYSGISLLLSAFLASVSGVAGVIIHDRLFTFFGSRPVDDSRFPFVFRPPFILFLPCMRDTGAPPERVGDVRDLMMMMDTLVAVER